MQNLAKIVKNKIKHESENTFSKISLHQIKRSHKKIFSDYNNYITLFMPYRFTLSMFQCIVMTDLKMYNHILDIKNQITL